MPQRHVPDQTLVASTSQPGRRSLAILGCILAVATALSYSNTLDVPFLFDDQLRIQDNPRIRTLWPISSPMADTSRPFGMYTFAVNHALHGNHVWGYHATNLAIHILSGLVLFGIVRRTLARGDLVTGRVYSETILAFAVALLWLLHPLNTQAVTYVVQRLESLMGLCYLTTVYCFIRAQDLPRRPLWYTASFVCCAVGMGVKEIMVTAPVMVLWYHRAFVADSWRAVFRGHKLYYAGLFSTWGILAWCMLRTQSEYSAGNIAFVKGLTPLSYLLSEAGVITNYLRLSVWPYGQCLDYGWPVSQTAVEIIPPLLFVSSLFFVTVWAIFRYPAWGFLGGWFFVILGPTSSVVPIIDLAFEQRMYLPLVSVVAIFVFALDGLIGYLASRRLSPRRLRLAGTCLVAVVAVQMCVITWGRNEVYRSEVGIWEDTVAKAPNNPRAHNNLAGALLAQRKFGLAKKPSKEAIRLDPTYAEAYSNLANAMQGQNELDTAIEEYHKAIRVRPNYAEAYSNLASALLEQGKFVLAEEPCREAIRLKPDYAEAYNNLGNALLGQGKVDEAIEQYREAILLKPVFAEAYFDMGIALRTRGESDLARDCYRQAIRLKPDYPQAYNNLAGVLQAQGQFDLARQQYCEAIRLKPDYAEAYHNRSIVYFQMQDYDHAWADIRACRQLGLVPNPAYVKALAAASGRSE